MKYTRLYLLMHRLELLERQREMFSTPRYLNPIDAEILKLKEELNEYLAKGILNNKFDIDNIPTKTIDIKV